MNVKFDLGEEKNVVVTIRSCKDESFVIDSAKWELFFVKNEFKSVPNNNGLESEGTGMIVDNKIYSLIKPKKEGSYILRLTYMIANETLIDNIPIDVSKWGH